MILSSFSVVTSSVLTPLLASAVGVESEFYAKALAAAVALVTVVVFLFAQLFGELAIRLSLPAVLGELIAGFILGVSGIHCIVLGNGGEVADWTVAAVQLISGSDTTTIQEVFAGPIRILLNQYAELGVGVLLFKIGLEADLEELIKVGPQAASVAVAGVILPFVAGFVGLTSIFHLSAIASIFAAAALTATSIGITSRIMQDMGVLNTKEGQIILGAAVLDDILGIAILAVAIGIAEHGTVEISSVISTIVSATLFVISAIVLNKVFGPRYINFLSRFSNPYSVLIGSIIFLSLMGTIANVIGLEEILGCFAAGIILGNTKATAALEKACEPLVALFATVFFVSIGAKTDLSVLNLANPESRTGLVIAAFLIVIAILGKLAAGYFVFSKENVNRLAIGTGMVPRGEVGLVFAGLGATTGTLTGSLNVAIVLMVIATTFVAPPMLRWVFASNQTVTNQEQQPVAK
ncbi:cation:proton antiporter [Leptolyngbyaceae cyanobacterium CCMR0082]|uniref:Cation:proton antiporter n=1 Tax=Adonisia turfae CCMR0082 TaxID=2304604 RepID=A0A6M0SFF0_9CYAN|nr:cation:proton antiporter [Adonisia turfae]NEZ67238.1 cation:proton antiporter [Adonisia turfae CCMR0082]